MRVVHVVIDEAAALGPMEVTDTMLSIGRGYGMRVHLVYQDVAQVMKCYPNGQHQHIMSITTNIFMGAKDWTTCEEISKRSGQMTVTIDSGGISMGRTRTVSDRGEKSTSYSETANSNWSFVGQPLIRPEQVAGLPDRMAITFSPGVGAPILTYVTLCHEQKPTPTWIQGVWVKVRNFGAAALLVCGAFLLSLAVADAVLPKQRPPAPPKAQPILKVKARK